MIQQELGSQVDQMVKKLKAEKDLPDNPIDLSYASIPPFIGGKETDEIKLVVIGQDPTIRNIQTRGNIKFTLNLDKNGSLKNYVKLICTGLNITIENVYATNLFKYSYTVPPADTPQVLRHHLQENLMLLQSEVKLFPNAKIICLGEPLLQLLKDDLKAHVKTFWSYNEKKKASDGHYTAVAAEDNSLNRKIYPYPHVPSMRKNFYKTNLENYTAFVRDDA
jgi:uracil-DNA glycosylase